jgi:predicted aspartyl protease
MRQLARAAGFLTSIAIFLASGASVPGPGGSVARPLYTFKLGPLVVPPARTTGLLIKVRINGGAPLGLLLDSGTQYLVLDRRTARRSGCTGGTDFELVGAGAQTPAVVKKGQVDEMQIGDLTMRDVPLLVVDAPLPNGIQGVLPLAIFAGFLIRLDLPAKTLDLLPYPSTPEDASQGLRAISSNQLLFVPGTVNKTIQGYFLLDTGASYTAISQKIARELNVLEMSMPRIPLVGGVGDIDAPVVLGNVQLRLGMREFDTGPVVAVDLATASRYHQVEVSGLLGYPTLRGSVVTLNYRDGLVRIAPR